MHEGTGPGRDRDGSAVVVTSFAGRSMLPTFRSGDRIVWVKPSGEALPCPGDIVGYWQGDRFIAHRVARVDPADQMIQTRGDANLFPDPPIRSNRVYYLGVDARRGSRHLSRKPPPAAVRLLFSLYTLSLQFSSRLVRGALAKA